MFRGLSIFVSIIICFCVMSFTKLYVIGKFEKKNIILQYILMKPLSNNKHVFFLLKNNTINQMLGVCCKIIILCGHFSVSTERDGPPSLFSSSHLLASPSIGFGFKRQVPPK